MGLPVEPPDFGDFVQPFQIEDLGLRGRLVRLGPALDEILAAHAYPAPVSAMLADALVLTVILASGLKYDGVFSLQTRGDGPLGMMVADLTSEGALRGYARYDQDRLAAAVGSGGAVPRLLGAGHLAFTVDQGPDMDRYQGITALEGASLADCARLYFRQSEQLDTALVVAACDTDVSAARRAGAARAAAMMMQRLPAAPAAAEDAAEDGWRRAVVLMSSVTPGELLDPALAPAEVLYRLFHEDGVRVFRPRPVRHACRCSRQRVADTLASFPADEIAAMAEDGVIVVTCEFCKTTYRFDEDDVAALHGPPSGRA